MPTVALPQVTPSSFATSLLQTLGAPVTPANVGSLVAWQAREGGNWNNTAHYNPLNTTQDAPGATAMNGVGVKAYQNWNQGLQATAATLRNGNYTDILQALHSGRGLSGNLAGLSKWSGGGYSSLDGAKPVAPSAGVQIKPVATTARPAPAPVRSGVPQTAAAEQIRAGILNSILPGLGSQSSQQKLGLYTPAQASVLSAHNDLQNLAGTTTLTTHPGTGEGGQQLAAMTKLADSLVGKPYVWGGGHSNFAPQPGYDCSGFVSAVLHAGGYLNAPQTTQTLPGQPGIANGPGKFVTVYDRTDGGTPGNDHVIVDLNGAWYESGGQAGAWGGGGGVQRIQKPSAAYLQSFNRQLHPMGL